MDVLAIEAAYGALDGDEDVECAIALAHRCLLRASNMPAGRERRRIIREATDELCTALERNVMEDPDFSHQSTRASAPASRTSSRKRVRSRKVIIDSSDSEAEEPHAKKDENAGSADNVEEMDITENVGNALTVTPPTRRSTRLAENLEKEVERNQSEMESAMQEAAPTAPTPAQTADANADVNDGDSSTSTISDTRELILPVVRPKPQVPPRPLVSDRASQTPFRTAEDEDTEEEAERSRRAHAPRPRQHLISDSGDDWHGLNGPEYPMDTSTEDEGSRIRNQFSTFGQGTVIASPLVVRPELPQPFERADVVMGQGERPVLPSNYPIAMPIGPRPPVAHRQGPALRNLQVQPLTSGSASGQFNSSGRIRQPANGASDIEAEIYAARASISQAQEQQNNWIQSLNAEQERRLRAARLYSQQQNSNRGVKAGGVSGANMPVNFPHIGQAAGLQSAQHARQGVSDISKARQPTGQRLPSAETLGNVPAMRPMYPVPQGAQNGVQLVRQASPVTNVSTLRGAVPLNTMSVPSAARQPQASLHSNAMQLQILQENRTLEKQNDALAELYARQNSQVQLRRQPANQPHIKPVSQEGMQLQLQEALRQQQLRERQFQMQMHQERMRRLREEQEKKKLEEQMKELEKQQQQIQERKKLILQQQIALQQKHLREQQLQQQQIREQQQQHQMQTGQASQASQQVQLQLKQQQQQQQLRQVHMQQQRLARPQRSQQQQVQQQQIRQQPLRQVQRQQRQMQQRPQQQLQSGHPQAQQQVGQRQHVQGHNVSAVQQSNIALGQSPVPGQANVSNISSVLPAQVASFSSALFSLNGTQGAGSHPRNQAIPASAPRASTLRAPSSAQSSVLPPSARPKVASSQYSNQRAQGVSPATRTAGVPAFQASSTVVAGNVQSVVGHSTNGRNAVSKNGQPGGSAPQAKRELLMNSGAAPGPTLSSATTNTSGEQPKRGRGRPRGSKNRLALPGPRPVATPIAPTSAAQAILPRTAAPVMTLLPDGTQILAIPLVRGNLSAGTEMGVAAQTAATAPVAPAAPAVRLNKRALLLWDAENLGGQNKRTKP